MLYEILPTWATSLTELGVSLTSPPGTQFWKHYEWSIWVKITKWSSSNIPQHEYIYIYMYYPFFTELPQQPLSWFNKFDCCSQCLSECGHFLEIFRVWSVKIDCAEWSCGTHFLRQQLSPQRRCKGPQQVSIIFQFARGFQLSFWESRFWFRFKTLTHPDRIA